MPLHELEEWRLARLPRPVDPAGDLHASPDVDKAHPAPVPAGVRTVGEPGAAARIPANISMKLHGLHRSVLESVSGEIAVLDREGPSSRSEGRGRGRPAAR
jgi:hypothetical protein